MSKPEEGRLPPDLALGDILKYADIVNQVIAVVKSVEHSSVGTTHQFPTIKAHIGPGYWKWDLGQLERLK
jgi:hypothetical protein